MQEDPHNSCCRKPSPAPEPAGCCGTSKVRMDFLLWGSLVVVFAGVAGHYAGTGPSWWLVYAHGTHEFLSRAWWGLLIGIAAVAVIGRLPREMVAALLGRGGTFNGILRATFAGVLLDLCNHGILMVAMQLYRKGASLGQVIAFLVASPWNSLSLTLILIALIGWQWTLGFIALSMAIGILSGWLAERLVAAGKVPANPNHVTDSGGFRFTPALRKLARELKPTPANLAGLAKSGWTDSRMILRWIFFGIALAGAIRAAVPADLFQQYFGPTLLGLVLTLVATTIIEVCSEGSSPIAADLLNRAGAPGNAFTFLMAGAATDYTEIMALRETTRSWRATLLLPLLTVPQVLVVSWLLNS